MNLIYINKTGDKIYFCGGMVGNVEKVPEGYTWKK
jgi:preprotein translocase subunit YajC